MEPSFGFRVFRNVADSIANNAYAQSTPSTLKTNELKQKIVSQELRIDALERRITAEEMCTTINSVSICLSGLTVILLSLKRRF